MKVIRLHLLWLALLPSCVRGGMSTSPLQVPFGFVENQGQADESVRYIGIGPHFKIWFQDRGVIAQQGGASVKMTFSGGREGSTIEASSATGARVNYLRGDDPRRWKTGLQMYVDLRYREVWPGIDVRFRSDLVRTKAEYVVAAGAQVDDIRLRFGGEPAILPDGSLSVHSETGEYREDRPVLFQDQGGVRVPVSGAYRIYPDGTVGFVAGPHDPAIPLTIDPTVLFSGYFGGNGQTTITSMAVNSWFNTVVAGWTMSTNLPASGAVRPSSGGGVDAFVASFSPAGGALNFCTYLGGTQDDRALAVAVDSSNNIFVTGQTSSANFPLMGAIQTRLNGARDAFVTKISGDGATLLYSTYLGGSGADSAASIALLSNGGVVVTGDSTSSNLPVTAGALQNKLLSAQNAFVAVLSPTGNRITALTYFGGNGTDHGAAVKTDPSDYIYIGGSTYSTNFPVLNAFQPRSGGGQDGFVAKLSADCKTLYFSTYYGGAGGSPGYPESVNAIAIGPSGNILVAGTTSSTNFPIAGTSIQKTFGGGSSDGFVGRLKATNYTLSASTYLGGSSDDGINAMAVDYTGRFYVAGYTSSTDFPTLNPTQANNGGYVDAFVADLNFTQIFFSTYLGGSSNDSANAIAHDSLNSITVAGTTTSSDFRSSGNLGTFPGAAISSFITKMAPSYTMVVAARPNYLFDVWHNTGYNGPQVTLNGSTFGASVDIPVAGDWDGSGRRRLGVFRNGTWMLDINGNGAFDAGDKTVIFGQAGDIPVVGDWNGTGRPKLGLFRRGTFILDLSGHLSGVPTGLSDVTFAFGQAGDVPVASDWNRSGATKVGVFRNGQWLIDYNGDRVFDSSDQTLTFGQAGDIPVIGDWDGSGFAKIGVYRQGVWLLDYENSGYMQYAEVIGFGSASYTPLVL